MTQHRPSIASLMIVAGGLAAAAPAAAQTADPASGQQAQQPDRGFFCNSLPRTGGRSSQPVRPNAATPVDDTPSRSGFFCNSTPRAQRTDRGFFCNSTPRAQPDNRGFYCNSKPQSQPDNRGFFCNSAPKARPKAPPQPD